MSSQTRIYVAGHQGMVGSAIVRALQQRSNIHLLTRTHAELDLTNQLAVNEFFATEKPNQVYLAAAKVGGIHANNVYPAEFIYQNLMIEANVIEAAYRHDVAKLLFLGSSCIYPKIATQPIQENALLTGSLEPTNEPYAIAKIAGIKLCESYNRQYGCDYRSVMPTNLYGPGDNYHLLHSHVLPAMLRKFHLAKLASTGDVNAILLDEVRYGEIPSDICQMIGFDRNTKQILAEPNVKLWGTGTPYREFLHVDDLASASIFVMDMDKIDYGNSTSTMCSHINVGYGSDITIRDVAALVATVVGYKGKLYFDPQKPDGTPRKLMDSTRLRQLGWTARIPLTTGISSTYEDYLQGKPPRITIKQ